MSEVMKAQIVWITPSVGAVRPTLGRTLAVMQVFGGSLKRLFFMSSAPSQVAQTVRNSEGTSGGQVITTGHQLLVMIRRIQNSIYLAYKRLPWRRILHSQHSSPLSCP